MSDPKSASEPKQLSESQTEEETSIINVEETPDEGVAEMSDDTAEETSEDRATEDDVSDADMQDALEEQVESADEEQVFAEDTSDEQVEQNVEQPVEEVATPSETVAASQPAAKSGRGALSLVFGGVIAAALGAGAALYVFPNGIVAQDDTLTQQILADLTAQKQAVIRLEAQLADLSLPPDLSKEVATLSAQVAAQAEPLATHGTRIEMLSALVGDLEKRPVADNLAPEAIAAYERELEALQAAMAQQRAEVEAKLAETAALRAEAEADATQAAVLEALGLVAQALDEGAPLTAALDALTAAGQAIPAELASVADGVPSLGHLQATYPDAARTSLAAERQANTETGVLSLLRDQLGVRSLTPQEGDSADAVLSRVEAALMAGDLATALTEAEGLPEAAATALAPWQQGAQQRQSAVQALSDLRQSVQTH